MPSTKVKHSIVKYKASWWKSKQRFLKWEMVGMRPTMNTDDLKLTWLSGARPLEVSGAIKSLTVARTIEGASTITMEILDPLGHLFSEKAKRAVPKPTQRQLKQKFLSLTDERGKPLDSPTLAGRAVEITLDDVVFRLTKVSGDLTDGYTLVFEDRIVYWLRHKRGAISASRADVTRAQFIWQLIKEIKTDSIPFICPQLSKKQAQATPDVTASLSELIRDAVMPMVDPPKPAIFDRTPKNTDKETPTKKDGLKNAKGLTVKGANATQEQKRNMNEVLEQTWSEKGMTDRAAKAVVLAVITETRVINMEGGDSTSSGILQLLASTAATYHVDPQDIGGCVHLFHVNGFWGKGGSIALAKAHPDWPAWKIAQYVQGSGTGQASEGRSNYGPWMDEAQRWLDAYHGKASSLDSTVPGGGSYRKSYSFKRDKDENSWECGLRLADEVQWRLFPIGRAMFYGSEQDLYLRKVMETVNKGDPRVLEFPWEMDWNKPINECSMKVILDDWSAYPGTVIMIDGYGAPDGRWLITEMERDWFGFSADLTLKQPLPPLKEPAPEVGKLTQGLQTGTDGDIGTLYKVCQHISAGSDEVGPTGASVDASMTPGYIIDHIILPISNDCGVPRTIAQNDAGNASHGPTNTGGRSDHQGPRPQAWAADMSNGQAPTPQMDKLANTLADKFHMKRLDMTVTGAGGSFQDRKIVLDGFQYQLIYRSFLGGNHDNHVHFGVHKVGGSNSLPVPAGHGLPAMHSKDDLSAGDAISLALWRADLWGLGDEPLKAGDFDKWGASGEGHLFTVLYNNSAVWIRFEEAAGLMYKRFDKTAAGSGPNGKARMRRTDRTDDDRFQKRHWPEM